LRILSKYSLDDGIKTPKLFAYGDTSDLNICVEYIRKKHPHLPLVGVGYSLGANLLTKFVGEWYYNIFPLNVMIIVFVQNSSVNNRNVFKGAVSVGQGYDGYRGVQNLKKSYFYHRVVTNKLKRLLHRYYLVMFSYSHQNIKQIRGISKFAH
jgi:predicted alpha/beta-fold hydrolase